MATAEEFAKLKKDSKLQIPGSFEEKLPDSPDELQK